LATTGKKRVRGIDVEIKVGKQEKKGKKPEITGDKTDS